MMPTPADILAGLTAIANGWRSIAVAWHLLLAACLLGLIRGWRPSRHLAGMLMTLPLVSVSALARAAGNPFNGAVFGALSLAFAGLAPRRSACCPAPRSRP